MQSVSVPESPALPCHFAPLPVYCGQHPHCSDDKSPMYLKRLELYGFKTFAERTDLEFGPGITAIVGPNGSGKSNISDAILWVLGEQGMKALRSAKSVDMIFNGSDTRKALGLAEVHLTLDNSTGLLPTDFTEVTITRRVFRSGDAEYLINRVPVRLRDVQDLFLDTGIGKQSYSIISQGEVDAVLSSRSEERRALFEEAAGINKYKHRKKEALRKLDQTRLNLLRVSDIISELDAQIEPLSEQSVKAREYQVFNTERTELQLSLLVTQYIGLQSSLARAKERENELQNELAGLRHVLQQTEIGETKLRADLQFLEDELDKRRSLENQCAAAVQSAESKQALLTQQQDAAKKEAGRLREERQEWEQQAGHFAEEIASAEVEHARLATLLREVEQEIAGADAAMLAAAGVVSSITLRIQEKRGSYLDMLGQASRVRNELARVESLLRTSEGRTTRINAELADVAGKIAERQQALQLAREQIITRQQERERITVQRGAVTNARQQMVEQQTALRKEESQIREELAGLRSRQHTLRELEESLEGYFPGVRAVVTAATAGQLRGWFAPVSELIDVPAELELAMEVALGANLQDVVTDSENSARAAVDFLKRQRAGRATFLPLDLLAPERRAALPTTPGVLGLAMDLISFDAQYEPAIQHLLGRVIVAQNLDAALALAKSNQAKGWKTIVTLEGEVVTPARTISGGSQGRGSGLLKRKRELNELTEKLAAQEKKAQHLQQKVQETSAEIHRLEGELTTLTRSSEQAASAIADAERTVATIQRDLSALHDRTTTLQKEIALIAGEIAGAKELENQHLQQLNIIETQQHALEAEIAAAEEELISGQQERDTLNAQHNGLRLRLTETRGEAQAQQNTIRRLTELRDSLATRLLQNEQTNQQLSEQLTLIDLQQRDAISDILRLRDAYARSTGELDGAKTQRANLLDVIATNLEQQKAGRATIEECQTRLHRADLRSTQIETELGFLENQLLDEYRLTPELATAQAKPLENRGLAVVRLKELHAFIEALGAVNIGAIEEFDRVRERLTFLTEQRQDLENARESLGKVIAEIDETCKEKFLTAFKAIGREFQDLFVRLFGGGSTQLVLVDPSDLLESGIEIHVTIPGKRNQNLRTTLRRRTRAHRAGAALRHAACKTQSLCSAGRD